MYSTFDSAGLALDYKSHLTWTAEAHIKLRSGPTEIPLWLKFTPHYKPGAKRLTRRRRSIANYRLKQLPFRTAQILLAFFGEL